MAKFTNPLISLNTLSLLLFLIISATANSEFCDDKMALLGGVQESRGAENSNEIESLARFAIEEHNKKEVFFFLKKKRKLGFVCFIIIIIC